MTKTLCKALVVVALVAHAPLALSVSICRWVDENGRTQLSDIVPEQYLPFAHCSDSRQFELSPEQTHEAEQRAAEQQKRARLESAQEPAPVDSGANARRAASSPSTKRPIELVTDATDCPTWWRIYDESTACFGPYRTTRGATKPEGFEMCNDVPSPETKCGLRTN